MADSPATADQKEGTGNPVESSSESPLPNRAAAPGHASDTAASLATPVVPTREPAHLAAALAGWLIVFSAAVLIGPHLPAWSASIGLFLGSLTLIGLGAWLVIGFQRLVLHRTTYLLLGIIGLAAVFQLAQPHVKRTQGINRAGAIPGACVTMTVRLGAIPCPPGGVTEMHNQLFREISGFVEPVFPGESTRRIMALGVAQLLLASGVGLWIGYGIDEIGHLIPIALVAGLADIWSVSAGATAVIILSPSIHYFLLRFPMLGGVNWQIPWLIGLTDFLFFAIFYTAAVRFSLPRRRTLYLLLSSFIVTVALALFFQVGLPVLPFMAVLFTVGNRHHLQVKRDDLVKVALFLLVCGAVAYGITVALHRT